MVEQITDYVGRRVEVMLKPIGYVKGVLCFFDWNKRVIHLSECVLVLDDRHVTSRQFMVINSDEWKGLSVLKEVKNDK